ncbi:MAG: hypothetical protein ACR2F6_13675 [Mycobacteriales bacterium]
MSDADAIDVERLARTPSSAVTKQVVELDPGEVLVVDAASWRDAIVFVTAGEIDVECASGAGRRFADGDILCFAQISVRAVRNRGRGQAHILVVRRRTPRAGRTG